MRPKLLDAFCGAGGAAMGYYRAGFDVVGIDIAPQPSYPFPFVRGDALAMLDGLRGSGCEGYAAIHASPPCQLFSAYQRANRRKRAAVNLIPETRELLRATGLPYVIENVVGAPLEDPAVICGVSVGLHVRRHRLFETNWPVMTPKCACGRWMPARFNRGSRHIRPNDRRTVAVGEWRLPLELQRAAMGIDWMSVPELSQAIPPAYTELLGHQMMRHARAATVKELNRTAGRG